jgi:tetratricopeptide (TPR) repeat protein
LASEEKVEKLRKEITKQALRLALETVKDPLQRELTMGDIFLSEGELGLAELSFSTVLEKAEDLGVRVAARMGLARVLRARKAWEKALRELDRAIEELKETKAKAALVSVVQEKAEILKAQGKLNEAKACLEKLWEEINKEGSEPNLKAGVAFNLGLVLQLLLHHREACGLLEEAEELWRPVNPVASGLAKLAQVPSLLGIGKTSEALVKVEEAEKNFANASIDPGLRKLLAWTRALCFETLGRLEEAIELKESALGTAPKASEFADLARLCFSLGKPEKAQEYETHAEALLAAQKDVEPDAYFALFSLAMMRGDISRAAKLMASLVDHYAGSPQAPGESFAVRMNQALLWFEQGFLGLAQKTVEKLLTELQELEGKGADVDPFLLDVLELRARLKNLANETEEAILIYQSHLELAQKLGRPMAIAAGYANLGQTCLAQGDLQRASTLLEEAEKIYQRCKAKLSLGYLGLQLAKLSCLGNPENPEGMKVLVERVEENKLIRSAKLDVAGLVTLAGMQSQSSLFEEASTNYLRALEICGSVGLELSEILIEALLGFMEGERGHKELAEQWLSQTLEKMHTKGIDIPLTHYVAERLQDITGLWW